MAKLFVSYSRKDSKKARKLFDAFKEMGHDVWVDWEDIPPAADWLEQIFRGIEQVDTFIFLVSPDSIKSEVCNVEIQRAALNNKRIVPVVIREALPKDANEIIRKLNWIFLRRRDDYEAGLRRIKEAIELDFAWVEEHSRLQNRALEWHRVKESSLLLRGSDLRRARQALEQAQGKEPAPTDLQKIYIKQSLQSQRRSFGLGFATALVLVLLAGLSYYAFQQRDRANSNARLANANADEARISAVYADQQRLLAENNAKLAQQNEQAAVKARQDAENQRNVAQAQRSAARAQIYQTQPGELYTSTLLAIDSWTTSPSDEANEILRRNISLLPIPVKQLHQEGRINALAFSPNGELFVTAGADGKACVWKVSDGTNLFCATSPGSVHDALFDPKGAFLVTGDDSGLVQILNAENGNVENTFKFGATVWDLDIRRDGKLLAVARGDGRITLIDLASRKESYDLQAFGGLRVASFSPDGRYIAAGSSTGTVTLWNLIDGGIVSSPRHRGNVLALAFSPDSRYLVTGGQDSVAVVARTSNGQEIHRLLQENWVEGIAFSRGGSWFATVSDDKRIRLWNTASGTERLRMSQDDLVQAVKVSANSQWLATTGADRTVRVWNTSTGAQMFQIPLQGDGTTLAFSADGKYLVAGDATGEIDIWDISVMPTPINDLPFEGFVGDVRFSSSGDWLAAADGNRVWLLRPRNLSTLKLDPTQNTHFALNGNVNELVFSPDSKWLGISTSSGNVLLYNFEGKSPRTIKSSGLGFKLGFTPDSSQLITVDYTGLVETWDVNNGSNTGRLAEGDSGVTSIAVSPNLYALGAADRILILNRDGKAMTPIESLGDHQQLTFTTDGSLLASSNSAGLVQIWRRQFGTFTLVGSIRKEAVYSLAFNPAGTQLAVGAANNVFLIDPGTVEETARIPHAGAVTGVSYNADGSILATSSLKVVQFWDLSQIQTIDKSNLIQLACSRLTANFTKAQWNNLFGGEPYRLLCPNLPEP